jgi:F-type H+-transporting ATPase subunit b
VIASILVAAAEESVDKTHSWILPEGYEIYFGGAAAITIFGLLGWKVLPIARRALDNRTSRIQAQLDEAAEAKERAAREADDIRRAKGDIDAERARLLGEADEQAAALITDGRERLDREVAELEAKASADIAAASAREVDELRAEIARTAASAADRLVVETLDDRTHQQLVEDSSSGWVRPGVRHEQRQ